jgi:MFS family permease
MASAANAGSLWTRAFALLCLAEFLCYAQHFLLQPTLPLYVTYLGGSPFVVGLMIAAFGVTSVISRPIIGYWVDRWSAPGMMTLGMIGQGVSVLFCLIPFSAAVTFSNALRGIGWSSMAASGYTLLATSAPPARRGEASGFFGGVQSSATIIFPAIALWVIDSPLGGFRAVFLLAVAFVFAGGVVAWTLSRVMARPIHEHSFSAADPWWREILNVVDRHILFAAALMLTLNMSLPCFSSFVVLYARELNVGHFGWYYVAVGVTSALGRPLLGRFSDKLGAGRSLLIAFGLETTALLTMPLAQGLGGLIVSGALWYTGAAIGGARIMALAMESAPTERRGRAMASYSTALPLSNGAGALISGLIVDLAGYRWMYAIAGLLCAVGFILILKEWEKLK